MTTVVIDWLGRGGIAQCTHAVADALRDAQVDHRVVTIADRELVGPSVVGVEPTGNRLRRHRALANEAARVIRELRADTVIVQNYVLPLLERPVVDAATEVGARLVWVVHDHQMHSLAAGTTLGLRRHLAASDVVVAHSHYVADRLDLPTGADLRVLPLPSPPEYHVDPSVPPLVAVDPAHPTALHFGVLKRRYKGTSVLLDLARSRPAPWSFAAVGVGAPEHAEGLTSVPRFVAATELAATVAAASATLFPYSHATQSGAVAQSQFSGTVPIATAVGGVPEQIRHGETGWLVDADAPLSAWSDALHELSDDTLRARIGASCLAQSAADHAAFEEGVRDLVR